MTLTKTASVAALAALLAFSIVPAAYAQGLPGPSDLTGTVGDTGGGLSDAVEGTAGNVTATVGNTTDEVTDTVDDTTGTVGNVTDQVTDTVDNTTGGATSGATDQVDNTTGSVGNTVGGVTDTVDETTKDPGSVTDPVTDPVTGTVEDISGGLGTATGGKAPSLDDLTPELVNDLVDEAAADGLSPAAAEGWIEGKKVLGATAYQNPLAVAASLGNLLGDVATDMIDGGSASAGGVTLSSPAESDSFFASAGRVATEAAKALAFPLALALLVIGFLAIQGRIGRKDPKLVLAPVDASQETLTFE